MRVLVFGDDRNFEEVSKRLGDRAAIDTAGEVLDFDGDIEKYSLVLDFTYDDQPEVLEYYQELSAGPLVLLNSVKTTLGEGRHIFGEWHSRIAGFNGMPGFVDRQVWEISAVGELPDLRILGELGIEWQQVRDRAGMVAPRVIAMIINEAYFTVQEGTADRQSIDEAMKLGTGYPMGPFEWAEHIGIDEVFDLLEAIYLDTRDERYKICPLLKSNYMLGRIEV